MANKKIVRKEYSQEMKSTCYNYYPTIKDAASAIETKLDNWKVQMLIVDAINTGKTAFKSKWSIEK